MKGWIRRRAGRALGCALFCATPIAAAAQPSNCSIPVQNLYLRDVLQEFYYWNAFLADPNPTRFPSPEAYLETVRYLPLDQSYSYIASKATTDAFFSSSQFVGFGLATHMAVSPDGQQLTVRVSQVFDGSPAAEAGLARGDRVLSVGGRSVTDWWLAGQIGEAFGPPTEGYETGVVVERAAAEPQEVRMVKRAVTIPTVSDVRIFEVNGVKTGYVFFRNFVEPSVEALDATFARLKEAGVRELILDLRYNGGGLVSVAQHLASLIGGARTNGLVLAEYFHNDRNAFRNRFLRFEAVEHALGLDRLVVITTRASASASELIINGLRPFLPVIVVGDTTYGKPVGQYGFDFCDKTAFPVSFSLRNASGEGDFFTGITPTCVAPDDLDHPLGDAHEASLAVALRLIEQGACESVPEATARRTPVRPRAQTGFSELIGAW